MDDYDQSYEEEYEYTYDDDSISDEGASDEMDNGSLEMDYDSPTRDSNTTRASTSNGLNSNGKQISSTNHSNPGSNKKKARSESLCGQIDVHMRDSGESFYIVLLEVHSMLLSSTIRFLYIVFGILLFKGKIYHA